ncbi:MAG TPA: UDP-N-acetylmuramoyl-L-alanine--D-glutamate ligase [Sedimentisphaerales bacterium]|nr:UDP-N-acetylmuramoyl-L-alanine--D-glutamate ligase [Sedimentisphaerales bacterium]
MNRDLFTGRQVLVMGLGRFGGGLDTAQFACRAGAKVTVTDLANAEQLSDSISRLKEFPNIEFHLGGHIASDFEQADIVIANPAVPPDNEFLQIAKQRNKPIASQIGIFFELCPATIIGITGANGKSTTAALTAHLLRAATPKSTGHRSRVTSHERVHLSGNIGNEPLLTILDEIAPDDLIVLELSSFQIEQLAQIRKAPHVALLTNLTPNHLDRYGTFEAYCAAKENIFKFQQNDWGPPAVSIFNAEDKIASEWFDKYSKEQGRVCIRFSPADVGDDIRSQFRLPGRANLSNLAAALAVARHFGVDDESIKACLPDFKALPHRLELVAEIKGVRWYNDSKATTPEGAITALEAFDEPEIIIAGGYDKRIPFDDLGERIAQKARAAILMGQTAEKIAASIRSSLRATSDERPAREIKIVNSLAEAVERARQLAAPGDVVLLSPACASYDMFENYEHRGRQFAALVRRITD